MDKHTATEMAYKNGYAKGYADGMKEFCRKLHAEILEARESNFKAKDERIAKYEAEDGFTMYCDGKIHALDGIDYFAYNLVKEMVHLPARGRYPPVSSLAHRRHRVP